MKKLYSIVAAALFSATVSAQAFTATYDFSGTPPTTVGAVTGSNVTSSAFTASGLGSTTTGNRFAWTDGTTATTPDLTKYFEVTVTPAAGYSLAISEISFRSQRSGTGPRSYVVRSSVDGYSSNLAASINPANAELQIIPTNVFNFVNDISTGQNGNVVSPAITNQTNPVTFRFYFFDAEATTGTFSVDDVVITGSVNGALAVNDVTNVKSAFVQNTQVTDAIHFGAKADVKIYNMNGQVVKTASVSNTRALDASDLQPGMYIVTGSVDGQPVSQKILKK